jgi:transglutaminase-like putative cysteine protease
MSWWLPNPDTVVFEHKGICWGYASLFAAMCRSQGIPCKICVGWSQKSSHAWNTVYSKVNGDITGIQIVAKKWNRMDVTYMDMTRGSGKTVEYIANDSNYKVNYFG